MRDDTRRRLHRALRRRGQGQRRPRSLRDGLQDAAEVVPRRRDHDRGPRRGGRQDREPLHRAGHTQRRAVPRDRAAGQRYEKPGTTIYRVADGRLAESWGVEDTLGWFRQLGKYTE